MAKSRIAPIHPGVYLKEILDEWGLSQYRLAQELGVPACGSAMWCVGNVP
jgi:antitoxin HigA-1